VVAAVVVAYVVSVGLTAYVEQRVTPAVGAGDNGARRRD
jgi:hypothetical protein